MTNDDDRERLDRAIRRALGDIVAAAPKRHDVPARPGRRWHDAGRRRPLIAAAAGLTAAAGIVAVVAVSTRTTTNVDDAGPSQLATTTGAAATSAVPVTSTSTPSISTTASPPTTAAAATTRVPTTIAAPRPGPLQRVEFRPGTNDAAIDGTIAPGTTDRYVLEAAAGQRMIVDVDTELTDIAVTIAGPDGSELASGGPVAAVDLPADGDYVVEVRPGEQGGQYTITFYIQ